MKTLDQLETEYWAKVDALRVQFERDKLAIFFSEKLGFKVKSYSRTFSIELKDNAGFKSIVDQLKPINLVTKVGTAGSSEHEINSPYRVDIENDPRGESTCSVSYESAHGNIEVEWLVRESEILRMETRKLYPSEYHYFIGTSHDELLKMKVRCLKPKSGRVISWYGGNFTLLSVDDINGLLGL